jgi:hypothetical protein
MAKQAVFRPEMLTMRATLADRAKMLLRTPGWVRMVKGDNQVWIHAPAEDQAMIERKVATIGSMLQVATSVEVKGTDATGDTMFLMTLTKET